MANSGSRPWLYLVVGLVVGAAVTYLMPVGGRPAGAGPEPAVAPSAGAPAAADLVARGEYLVTTGACDDCHTPFTMGPRGPEPDMTRRLSGHPETFPIDRPAPPIGDGTVWLSAFAATNTAYSGPWGVSFAANLTPDENTGLGIWTEDMFIKTLRTGKHWGQSRDILPPMPWPAYSHMTDEDLQAIFAYLRTVPPIPNRVPEPLPPAGTEPSQPAAG